MQCALCVSRSTVSEHYRELLIEVELVEALAVQQLPALIDLNTLQSVMK